MRHLVKSFQNRGDAVSRRAAGLASLSLFVVVMLAPAATPAAAAECPNEAFRTGLSADLPDCRAYELVTSSNLDGRVPEFDLSLGEGGPSHTATELGSPNGNSYVYLLAGEPLLEPGEPNGVQDVYETVRTKEGWRTVRHLSPSGTQAELPISGGVSPDHQYSFVEVAGKQGGFEEGSLAAEGPETSYYLQRPDGSFEPIGVGSLGEEREAFGHWVTSEGTHIVFSSGSQAKQLEPTAPPTGTSAVYDRSANGPTRVVSLLPGNVTPSEGAVFQGASADGSVVAFKIGSEEGGAMYVRVDNASTEEVTGGGATFAGISAQGRSAFYVRGGNIFEFGVASGQTRQVNSSGDAEITHISEDGSHVYFISPSLLDGAEGTAGEDNLYVWDAATETVSFIATVSPSDLGFATLADLNHWTTRVLPPESDRTSEEGPGADGSRTSSDGSVFAFQSKAKLTAYENNGHTEIYRYDTRNRSLLCVSCNPSEEPATGDAQFEDLNGEGPVSAISAHIIVHNLSADGLKVVFETEEALVPRDRDENNDIYEWSAEGGTPSLTLISSGQTPVYRGEFSGIVPANKLAGVTPNGDDVFFFSTDALTPSSGLTGAPAIYDARVGGGFAESAVTKSCSGDECQPAVEAPQIGAPPTEILGGAGNLAPPASKPPVKAKPKPLTRAQKLARALKRCKKDKAKKKRAACQKSAHKRYGRRK